MLRRLIVGITSVKNRAVQTFGNQAAGQSGKEETTKDEKKQGTRSHQSKKEKKGFPTMVLLTEIVKLGMGITIVGKLVEGERRRISREEHLIMFGKQGSGVELVCNELLGEDINKEEFQSIGCFRDVKGINKNEKLNRNVKISYLILDDDNELYPNIWSSLSISHDYSVVFCFPVSYRFTIEDYNLLNTYLQYRQREDYTKISVVFTYADNLKDEEKQDYIDKLPSELKDVLKKFKNQYYFFSNKTKSITNVTNIKTLIKHSPGDDFLDDIVMKWLFYVAPHFYFLLKL